MQPIHFCYTKKNPLVIPTMIAKEKGFFEKRGLEVTLDLAEDFNFGAKPPFLEGKSDVMMGDLTFFFYMLEQGKQAVLTSNLTRTIHVVGRSDIRLPQKGIKVGVNRKGLFRLLLENDLKDKMPEAEIVWLNNSYERMAALDSGEIDALVAIEPFITDLTDKGYQVLWSMRESDKNLVMWCFDKTFYTQNLESVKAFHEALEEAGNYFNSLTSEARVILCHEVLGYELAFAERMADFVFEKQQPIRESDFELCQEWMLRTKEITQQYAPENCIVQVIS